MPIGQPTFKPGSISLSGAQNVKITNLSITLANTEFNHTLQNNLKKLEIHDRTNAKVQFCFVASQSSSTYVTINKGCNYSQDGLDLSGKTIYLQADKITVVEIIEFY